MILEVQKYNATVNINQPHGGWGGESGDEILLTPALSPLFNHPDPHLKSVWGAIPHPVFALASTFKRAVAALWKENLA